MRRVVTALAGLAVVLAGAAGMAKAGGAAAGGQAVQVADVGPRSLSLDGFRALPNRDAEQESRAEAGRTAPGGTRSEGPLFLWGQRSPDAASLQALRKLQPLEAALAQLPQVADALGVDSLAQLGVQLSHASPNELGQTVVRLTQQVEGLDVFRGTLSLLLDRDNRLVAATGFLSPLASSAKGLRPDAFTLGAPEAIARAYGDVTGEPLDAGLLARRGEAQGGYASYDATSLLRPEAPVLAAPARARRVLYPLGQALLPAWYLELTVARPDSPDSVAYAYVVDAREGRLLMRQDLTHDADLTFRAWVDGTAPYTPQDGPTGSVATPHPRSTFETQASYLPYAPSTLVTLPRAPNARGDAWLPEGASTTDGNNVRAYADVAAPDGYVAGTADFFATASAPDTFDWAYDPTLPPAANQTQRMAAVSQLFFVTNWLHDWFYPAGFDEASGNAQLRNHGRGGAEGDPLRAEAQDYSGMNNANMRTPADGASPIMQMYVFRNIVVGLDVTAPASIAGTYRANGTTIGPQAFEVTGEVVRGVPAAGCRGLRNAGQVSGRIVLIDWVTPGCSAADLLAGAREANAAGILLAYNDGPNPDATPLVTGTLSGFLVPMLVVSRNTAEAFDARARDEEAVAVRMWRQEAVDLDGSIDNAIVAHEWGHYLSNRLISNGVGLGNNQGRAMGEGWGDFLALLMAAREEDAESPHNVDWTGAWPVATYAPRAFWGPRADYFGIRRTPYSVDRTRNALSFRHIANGQPLPEGAPMMVFGSNAQVHNSGEVWATMLWEAYVSLLRAHPFAEAQRRMKSYLVTGLKLTPPFPTFTEARDALLAAALANDTADFERMSAAFASRGAGVGAVAPPRWSTNHAGVVESDAVGGQPRFVRAWVSDDTQPTRACDRDGVLDEGESGTLHVVVENVGWRTLGATTVSVTSGTRGVLVHGGSVTLPPLEAFSHTVAHIPVSLEGVTEANTPLSFRISLQDAAQVAPEPETLFEVQGNYDEVAASSRLESVEGSPAQLPWEYVHDTQLSEAGWVPAPLGDANHAFWGPNHGARADLALVSPPLQVGEEPLVLTFAHAWRFEADATTHFDGGVLELSEDGGRTWVDLGAHVTGGPGYGGPISDCCENPLATRPAFVGSSPGWPQLQRTTVELGTAYAHRTVRLRFRIGTDAAAGEEGWYVDEVEVRGITNTPFTSLQQEDGVCRGP